MFKFVKETKEKLDKVFDKLIEIQEMVDMNSTIEIKRLLEFNLKDEPIMDIEERKNYVADVSVAFEKVIKPKIEKLIFQQKEYIASKGLKDEFEFDRGTMNGILTVFEEFEKDHLEHLDNVKPKEPFDKFDMMNELTK